MTQTASSVGGGFFDATTLKASGAPPDALRGLSEDHFRLIVADADRSLEARKEDYLMDWHRVILSKHKALSNRRSVL